MIERMASRTVSTNGKRVRLMTLFAVALAVCACGQRTFSMGRIDRGDVLTAGVVIRADDASFQYAYGQSFDTPWTAGDCPMEPSTSNWALAKGAKPVVVYHPASKQPLHGLLAYCPVPPAYGQPSARSHGIQIPERYVTATQGGLVSVVYDVVKYDWRYRDDSSSDIDEASEWPTWILWLRERPF